MPSSEPPTAGQLAQFDQAYAGTAAYLDDMVAAFRSSRASAVDAWEVDVVGLCVWLRDNAETPALAELLAVAISRLAEVPDADA